MTRWIFPRNVFSFSSSRRPVMPTGFDGSTRIKINETFFSIQGEGRWTGMPAWFIRLQGCKVGCPWCDSKNTWPESQDDGVSFVELVRQIPYNARHVVVTGGEPFEQRIRRLLKAIDLTGRRVQVETSGCYDVERPGWITVSPKRYKPLSKQALKNADEIKQVVTCADDIKWMQEEVLPYCSRWIPVYLQPVSNGQRALELCIEECKRSGYLLSLQTHKMINIP